MRRDFLKVLTLGLLAPRLALAQRVSYGTLPTEQHTYNPGKIEEITQHPQLGHRDVMQTIDSRFGPRRFEIKRQRIRLSNPTGAGKNLPSSQECQK